MENRPALHVYYRPEMAPVDAPRNFSTSPSKPRRFVEFVQATPLWPHLEVSGEFAPVQREQVLLAHEARYADAFLSGEKPLCESNGLEWFASFRDSVLWTNGALLAAVRAAIDDPRRPTMAPVSGFHHATPRGGSGFCTFSGQVITALTLYRERGLRGAWLDLDGHFGNSIEDSRAFAPDLNEAIAPRHNINPRGSHGDYLADLDRHLAGLRTDLLEGRVDYVCVAHGADSHEWDSLGHQCSTAEWLQASERIYSMLAEVRTQRAVAVTLTLFGGYRADHPESVLGLHAMDLARCLSLVCGIDDTAVQSYSATVKPRS